MRQAQRICGVLVSLALSGGTVAGQAQDATSLDSFGLLVAQQSRPSFTIIGAGARPAGMGGAFTALADDASAASFNPAGLALLVLPETSLVFDATSRADDHRIFSAFQNGQLETYGASRSSFDTQDLNFFAFTAPMTVVGRNLTLQISYHRLIDFELDTRRSFEETVSGGVPIAQLMQTIDQSGDIHTLSLAAAYQLTQRLSLGATLSRWEGNWDFTTRTEELELPSREVSSLRFEQVNSWSGWNTTVGALLRYPYVQVGAAFRSSFAGTYEVNSSLATNFATPFPQSSRALGSLNWPTSWTVGVAILPWDAWVLSMDYSAFDWDEMVIKDFGGAGAPELSFVDLKPTDLSKTRSTNVVRFGTEYTLFPGRNIVALRLGAFREPRPQLLTASSEANERRGFSVGLGWRRGNFAIDLALQHATYETRILQFVDLDLVEGGVVSAPAEGIVDTTEDRFFVSFLYHLESKKALKKVFHFLFVGPNGSPGDEPEEGGGTDGGEDGGSG